MTGRAMSNSPTPAGSQGNRLVVGTQPAEAEHAPHQKRQRQGDRQERQQQSGKQGQDTGEGDPLVDDQVGQLNQTTCHQRQSEDQQAQQSRGKQFPEQVTVDRGA